ncbi:MAG: sodium-dependent bicarbonate transport family permease [Actinomycetota bacterium]|jgi:hypothetical protein|nr:sodium-dependent bicarbonate transport family permease [Actinomycetota bacterium]
MSQSFDLALTNLTSVAVLVFILGVVAARLKSNVAIPDPVYQIISVYLLFGIGLKGGNSLKGVDASDFLAPAVATLFLGVFIPLIAFFTLKVIKGLNQIDRGSLAAHYGSTSLVTFSAALIFIENSLIEVEGFATALLTLLEIPGLIVGIYLGSRKTSLSVNWFETLKEVILGKTILLLSGGLIIGFITTNNGFNNVTPFFIDLQAGILVLFLLHLGYLTGSNWFEIRKVGRPLIIFGILFPIFAGFLGVVVGSLVGLSIGGAAILGVLSASGSYIAAPAAVSVALPKANLPLALMSSIGVTFPFNLLLGIPLYIEMAKFFSF